MNKNVGSALVQGVVSSVGCECVVFVAGRVSYSFWCYKLMPNFNKHFFFFSDHTFKMN